MTQISFTGLIFKEKDMYVAYCPELDVSSCGHKIDEARKNLKEAVGILLDETERMGTMEDILSEAGYIPADKQHEEWSPPHLISTEKMKLTTSMGA
jgi:predicted RNase H-like HicB family nuclease